MSSEENLIKAFVTKMVSEDDLTSAAFHFCLSLYFYQSPFTYLSSLALPLFLSFLCLCCWLDCLNINEAVSPMYYKHKRTVIKDDISKPHSLPLSSLLFFTGDRSLLDNI